MSSVVLNSDNNLSPSKNNLNIESDTLPDDSLFSSLFVIISEDSKENSLIERNLYFNQENQADGGFNIDHDENKNELFSIFDEKFLLNDYKKSLNPNNLTKEIIPKYNSSFSDNSFEFDFEILSTNNTKEVKDFSKNFSEIVKKINDETSIKKMDSSLDQQKIQNNEKIYFLNTKSKNSVINKTENPEDFNLNKLKFKEFSTDLDNKFTKEIKQDFLLNSNKKEFLNKIESYSNPLNFIKSASKENVSKVDNAYSFSQVSNVSHNTNIFNQNMGGNFNGGHSFYSGQGNSIDYLNMLDKTWGNNLLNKIEKIMKNGEESLEISLKPKNLGKMKITLSLTNDTARINIITENSSAALLLSEAESKLSQMLENTGLKLSNFSTNSDQSKKNNTKNGNQDNTGKKMLANDEISLEKGNQMVSKINSENQILNLLA